MPHNTSTETAFAPGDEWRWLEPRSPAEPQSEPTQLHPECDDTHLAPEVGGHEHPRLGMPSARMWMVVGATVTVAAVLVLIGALTVADHGGHTPVPAHTAAPPTNSAAVASGACAGLSGTTVTDREGDTATIAGVVASFENAYYRLRDVDAALRVVAPEAGLAADALAAGIASIPAGSTYCVAITPIAAGSANVHVVEQRPDRTRIDYLQVINIRPTDNGLLITNIQKQAGP
ncbi:hypothetical protein [Nocardia nova]|uniref:DUF8176 domain-containing protein n=1 Tax=Nocardia nova TaxID=37330 RepID=A0A2S6A6E1_9NOCA|nr:hypothetical protein [Nocardia nova]PPI93963.1 hypothetical protein C5E46_23385 [Nocardia nova]PPJ28038.1 hypothetical protein C5F51_14440 [Nocardia nova]